MKLAELTTGQTVYHPFYGKGIIHGVYDSGVSISFEGRAASIFWDDRFANAAPAKPMHLISHLYTEPVNIVTNQQLEDIVSMARDVENGKEVFGADNLFGMTEVDTTGCSFKHYGWEDIAIIVLNQ